MIEAQPTGAALVRAIIRDVAARHHITPEDLTGPKVEKRLHDARCEAVATCRARTRFSLRQLSGFFGDRHPATIHNMAQRKRRLKPIYPGWMKDQREAAAMERTAQALIWQYGPERGAEIFGGRDTATELDLHVWDTLGTRRAA